MPIGRPPKPTAVKIAEGSRIRKRERNSPQPQPNAPPMPARLAADAVAAAKWQELLPLLCSMRVMTNQDAEALATLCEVHAAAQACLLELRASGSVIHTDLGGVKPNPAGSLYRALVSQQTTLMAEFGLTPASRVRLGTTQTEQEEDPLAKFLVG